MLKSAKKEFKEFSEYLRTYVPYVIGEVVKYATYYHYQASDMRDYVQGLRDKDKDTDYDRIPKAVTWYQFSKIINAYKFTAKESFIVRAVFKEAKATLNENIDKATKTFSDIVRHGCAGLRKVNYRGHITVLDIMNHIEINSIELPSQIIQMGIFGVAPFFENADFAIRVASSDDLLTVYMVHDKTTDKVDFMTFTKGKAYQENRLITGISISDLSAIYLAYKTYGG